MKCMRVGTWAHGNEDSAEKIMNITEEETFVKENYTLTSKRVTACAQLSTEKEFPPTQSSYSKERAKMSNRPLLKTSTLY